VEVKRSNILEDSLKVLQKNLPKLKMPATRLKISFHREEGIDQGGLKKEWFSLLINNLFDPKTGLFKLSHNLRCLYPNPQSIIIPNSLSLFRAAGNIIGLVIYLKMLNTYLTSQVYKRVYINRRFIQMFIP